MWVNFIYTLEAWCMKFMHGGEGKEREGSGLKGQSDIPLTIQDCWLPTAHLPAFLIASNRFCCQPDHPLTTPMPA